MLVKNSEFIISIYLQNVLVNYTRKHYLKCVYGVVLDWKVKFPVNILFWKTLGLKQGIINDSFINCKYLRKTKIIDYKEEKGRGCRLWCHFSFQVTVMVLPELPIFHRHSHRNISMKSCTASKIFTPIMSKGKLMLLMTSPSHAAFKLK